MALIEFYSFPKRWAFLLEYESHWIFTKQLGTIMPIFQVGELRPIERRGHTPHFVEARISVTPSPQSNLTS